MAARFFVGGNGNNWGAAGPTNWSTTSGGAPGAAVPTGADDVTFDNVSPNCTLDTSNRVCKTLTATTYTNTLTFTFKLSVSGNITLGSSMVLAGAAALEIDTTGTITTNGKTINIPFNFLGNSQTMTLADPFNVSGLVTLGNGSGNLIINSNVINASGSLTRAAVTNTGGTGTILFNGTGTWANPSNNGNLALPITINTAGTLTITGSPRVGGNFTYTAGTVVTTGSTLTITGACTLSIGGVVWNNMGYDGAGAIVTLSDAITLLGSFNGNAFSSNIGFNGFSITIPVNFSLTNGIRLFGTTAFLLTGSGTWSFAGGSQMSNPVTINTTGSIAVTGLIIFSGVLTLTAGTTTGVIVSGGGGGGSSSQGFPFA